MIRAKMYKPEPTKEGLTYTLHGAKDKQSGKDAMDMMDEDCVIMSKSEYESLVDPSQAQEPPELTELCNLIRPLLERAVEKRVSEILSQPDEQSFIFPEKEV